MPTFSQTDLDQSTDLADDVARRCTSFRIRDNRIVPCPRQAAFQVIAGCPCGHDKTVFWCHECREDAAAGLMRCNACDMAAHEHYRFIVVALSVSASTPSPTEEEQ